jgi:hypothetical protein
MVAVSILFLLLALAFSLFGRWCYNLWESPTLKQKLVAYGDLTGNIAQLHDEWETAEKNYNSIAPYYRMVWARASLTNLFSSLEGGGRLPGSLQPISWTIDTTDSSTLKYRLHFTEQQSSKRQLCDNAANSLRRMMQDNSDCIETNSLELVYPDKDLHDVSSIDFTVQFNLVADAAANMPPMPEQLKNAVAMIENRRESILECEFKHGSFDGKTVRTMLGDALAMIRGQLDPEDEKNLNRQIINTMDPGRVLRNMKEALPADGSVPEGFESIIEEWNRLASRRFPWMRFKELDNEELANEIATMKILSESGLLVSVNDISSILDSIEMLRNPLLKGYDEAAVFDEGVVKDCITRLFQGKSMESPRIDVQRQHENPDILLVLWKMRSGAGDSQSRGSRINTVEDVLDCIHGILALQNGMQIGRVELEINGRTGRDLRVGQYSVQGLLPVRREDKK